MTPRPPTALFRFLLVGLMAVARLLCPCPAADAAHAAQLSGNSSHSCCGKVAGKHGAQHQDRHHGDGCEHGADSPQMKPAVGEGAEASLPPPGEPLALAALLQPEPATTLTPRQLRPTNPAYPPPALWRLRTVVLLI